MNTTERITKYKEIIDNAYSPTLMRGTLGYSYNFPEKSPKKERKWTISSLFRKKKRDESESSSDDEMQKKGFLNRRRKKNDKKKKPTKPLGTFDHVVLPRNQNSYLNGYNVHDESGILSDPTNGFACLERTLSDVQIHNQERTFMNEREYNNNSATNLNSGDSFNRKNRRSVAKARAEARRNTLKNDSSSEEDSQRSASSNKFHSEESLINGYPNRKSRAARTERYIKRHSRDGEFLKDYLRLCKSDAENFNYKYSDDSTRSPSRSPIIVPSKNKSSLYMNTSVENGNVLGLSTIPPSHGCSGKIKVSNSTSNPSYKPPLSMNDYNNITRRKSEKNCDNLQSQKSMSCDSNIHKTPSFEMDAGVLHVQLPLGRIKAKNVNDFSNFKQPPPPPPRDPKRLNASFHYDNGRPKTYFDCSEETRSRSFNFNPKFDRTSHTNTFNLQNKSTSENNITADILRHNDIYKRPSSVSPNTGTIPSLKSTLENYNYLTDKKPRSRKPIVIHKDESNKSETQKVIDFWKKKDLEGNCATNEKIKAKSEPTTPQIFTCQTQVQTQIFLPSVINDGVIASNLECKENDTNNSPFQPISSSVSSSCDKSTQDALRKDYSDEKNDNKHKSTNLEEALDELEAIYNSLRLGDEDLLERAEQREKDAAAQMMAENRSAHFPTANAGRGTLSDSSFSYEPFNSVDSPRRKKLIKKARNDDRKGDDMAYRKINKERSATIGDPHSVVSKVSYLMATPVYNYEATSEKVPSPEVKNGEPDVTLDDVLYRNIKRANSNLKVNEHPPPFGIPIGPITKSSDSDYLHAVPENTQKTTHKVSRRIPDLVKDDLAFRNLRKDVNKDSTVPHVSVVDMRNNNTDDNGKYWNALKKRRAIRSLSANIGNLLYARPYEEFNDNSDDNERKKLSDISDAMTIARQVLKEKEDKINATKKALQNDTETNNAINSLTESRLNFLNSLKAPSVSNNKMDSSDSTSPREYFAVPTCSPNLTDVNVRSPKESTPAPSTPPQPDFSQLHNSFENLLAALAVEARETSERITNDLKKLSDYTLKHDDQLDNSKTSSQEELSRILNGVVDSTDLQTLDTIQTEEVENIAEPLIPETVANIVLTLNENESNEQAKNTDSDHDYENLMSDSDTDGKTKKQPNRSGCLLTRNDSIYDNLEVEKVDNKTNSVKRTLRRSRARLPRWHPPHCGNLSDTTVTTMSEGQEGRAERIARYKEERRKQLAQQIGTKKSSKENNAMSLDEVVPRTTRASRLRAQATSIQESVTIQYHTGRIVQNERSVSSSSSLQSGTNGTRPVERDKSSKRKSNLNRALNSEEIATLENNDDIKNRRRRRRFFPQEVLDQSPKATNSSNERLKTEMLNSASSVASTSPNISSPKTTPRKSDLSVYMENARRGMTPPCSEMGKYKPLLKRSHTTSPRLRSSRTNNDDGSQSDRTSKIQETRRILKPKASSDNDSGRCNRNVSKKMEELTALTKETLARVERLANRTKENNIRRPLSVSPIKQMHKTESKTDIKTKQQLPSILKKHSDITIEPIPSTILPGPVSILKRNDHQKNEGSSSTPVTFSPNVVEPSSSNKKQGILKKRRSLDESQVLRHRSCSPDVANKASDSRSILKNQRRSSMEELTRSQSPELQLHSILKRKSLKYEEDGDLSLNSPQGILKRRSGASSAGSTNSTPHVSITTAVILAAAGGAEMVLDDKNEVVKPILKKKSISEEYSFGECQSDVPKPILKKKSSTDTDECDEKPMKPILKTPKSLPERDITTFNVDSRSTDNDNDVKPILKQRDELNRPRLSFSNERDNEVVLRQQRTSRRSHTICSEFNPKPLNNDSKEEDRSLSKPRPLSVFELVMNFESVTTTSTGAIPKRSNLKRQSDRYKTQPVTSNELEASLNLVRSPHLDKFDKPRQSSPLPISNDHSNKPFKFDLSSLENDAILTSYLSTSVHTLSSDSGVCGKMSSDSAFQSLGDGLELDDDDKIKSPDATIAHKPNKLEMQMKAIALEAQKIKLGKSNAGIEKYRNRKVQETSDANNSNRFSTQPITFAEVQEASKIKSEPTKDSEDFDPSNLTLSDRIKLFNAKKAKEEKLQNNEVPRRRVMRFQTQPITLDEVQSARFIAPHNSALEKRDKSSERKGILKSSTGSQADKETSARSVLKRNGSSDEGADNVDRNSYTYDEGISCNDSASDSENATATINNDTKYDENIMISKPKDESFKTDKSGSDNTSDGESSGGQEIRQIMKNDKMQFKKTLEGLLSKSKSQSVVTDETTHSSTIRRSQTQSAMPRSIAELQAKLQKQGESEWKKRVQQNNNSNDELKLLKDRNKYNDELTEKSILATKKDELDTAAKQWKTRVEKSDAELFSVSGRMESISPSLNISNDNCKKTPQAKRFRGRDEGMLSTPTTPEKIRGVDLMRSFSVPDPAGVNETQTNVTSNARKVEVSRPDDDTFKSFFTRPEKIVDTDGKADVALDDLDVVERQPLLVQRKNVQLVHRRMASKNPVKALAARPDILNEYTEVLTGVAERESKRMNIEKLAKHSSLAIEALAGLASNEDFKLFPLKKAAPQTRLIPYKDTMLLQVKGRRHIQTRLVEPKVTSLNEGDCFILITSDSLYSYIGPYSNIIEQSRTADIVNHIQQTGDMGCNVEKVITINANNNTTSQLEQVKRFWKILGADENVQITKAGHPSEDEIYESNILNTNMIYQLENDELVPVDGYWGTLPKIEILGTDKVYVFDFGTEMYVWSGKTAPLNLKSRCLKLAKQLWDEGYDYSECNVCPLNVFTILGDRPEEKLQKSHNKRPDWALFAKLTQYRETILFKEKFLDWPDFSRIIRVKSEDSEKSPEANFDVQPCNIQDMLQQHNNQPDFVIERNHLGRGDKYFDEETKRLFEFSTVSINIWKILENTSIELSEKSFGQFYDTESYILRWRYRINVKGRELSGKPSKYGQSGREQCVYFCWQGAKASVNEKGVAALLTIELDEEKAPQIRVVQGMEPAVFLRLFNGSMVVHDGESKNEPSNPRLYLLRGEIKDEVSLLEVPCEIRSLRSRTSFVIVDSESEEITIWHGSKSTDQTRNATKFAVDLICKNKPSEFGLEEADDIDVDELEEGKEDKVFRETFGTNRDAYLCLKELEYDYDYTLKMYHMSSVTGSFVANELLCPHRSDYSSPYPFLQNELYSAPQPALFLVDNRDELWIWQGWWPETEEVIESSDQTGSGAVRWQAERRAAIQTAVNYWRNNHDGDESIPAYLVWAGLEPLEFKNLFPTWTDRDDIAEFNSKDGRKPGTKLLIENELALLTRSTYPLSELLNRPLPVGVDPTRLEIYLSPEDFQEILSMTKEEFQKLPSWKQTALKKEKGLF